MLIAVGLVATGLAALTAGPVLLAVAGIGALIAGAGALVWHWDAVKEDAVDGRLIPSWRPCAQANLEPLTAMIRDMVNPQIEAMRGYRGPG